MMMEAEDGGQEDRQAHVAAQGGLTWLGRGSNDGTHVMVSKVFLQLVQVYTFMFVISHQRHTHPLVVGHPYTRCSGRYVVPYANTFQKKLLQRP